MDAADLISALLGLGGAIALGWPAFHAVRAKRYFEAHRRLQNSPGLSETNKVQLEKLGRRVTSMQLGGAREALVANAIGATLLGGAFLFLLLAGIQRRAEKAPVHASAPDELEAGSRPSGSAVSSVP